ncbi:GroES-like protein [Patellaria atrata CBS 101060]|uniref:GroES-like protein n=1 Tax=Patellaria atrata CBS 101060 TaxID=1346257 RepID=A0A9P4S7K4_9PEZI|nr:GroES-like protein [Patellaria atrata CBS 101060]
MLPTRSTCITIQGPPGPPGKTYYPLHRTTLHIPPLGPTSVLIRLTAASLNHRDLFIRQNLYPRISFHTPLLADGCGIVIGTGSSPATKRWAGKRVVLTPGYGWASSPDGPEDEGGYRILGGTATVPLGTLQEYAVVEAGEVEEVPGHLSDVEAAALPLTGLTAWRALFTKCAGHVGAGKNVLVTGVGGGVALMVVLFAVGVGANVFEHGGIISLYGMTTSPSLTLSMPTVLKNIEIRTTTMGSRAEFAAMLAFVRTHKLRPVISRVVKGLDVDKIDGLFEDMKAGRQFGKLVVEIAGEGERERDGGSRL